MKNKHTSLLLTISLTLNVILGAFIIYTHFFEAPPTAVTDMKEAGTYGPDSVEIIEGDATIAAAGITLQNTIIKGNLTLAETIADGKVDLLNVTVEGTTLVQGGGEESIVLENALINHLHICKEEGKVKVNLKGSTLIGKVTLEGKAALETTAITGEGGIKELLVAEGAEAEFNGLYPLINIAGSDVKATLLNGKIDKLVVAKGSSKCLLSLAQDTELGLLEAGEALELAGEGLVKEILITSPGLTRLAGKINLLKAGGKGIFLEIDKSTTDTLVVEPSDGTVMIHLLENAAVNFMELNGTAGITGKGSIESVLINAQGTVIEQSPGKVELAKDITAEIAGKEVRAEEEVKPEPEPEKPEPDLPPVSLKLDSTGSLTLLAGEKGVRTITSVSPGDANIKVSSSKTGVATASLSGNQITITGKGTGTATITVTASKSNYKKKSVSFKVSVVGVKSVGKHENYPLLGSTEIRIFLGGTSSPASYKVSLYGQTLEFEKGYFYLAVPSNSDIAQKSTSEIKGAVVISK